MNDIKKKIIQVHLQQIKKLLAEDFSRIHIEARGSNGQGTLEDVAYLNEGYEVCPNDVKWFSSTTCW